MSRTYRKTFYDQKNIEDFMKWWTETPFRYCSCVNWDIELGKKRYAESMRDGNKQETTSNTGFKNQAKRKLRRDNKRFCHMVVKDSDFDNTPLPNRKDSKQFTWDWW